MQPPIIPNTAPAWPPPRDQNVRVRHPAYDPNNNNILLQFPVVDFAPAGGEDDDDGTWGVHFDTVLVASQIVAANAFGGWLATGAEGIQRVDDTVVRRGVLPAGDYYFVVDSTPLQTRYAIVPTFRDWSFPEDSADLPGLWRLQPAVPMGSGIPEFGPACQLTGFDFPDIAHLVPRSESGWLQRSSLSGTIGGVDALGNRLWLRSDIHNLMDRKTMALVPKHSNPQQQQEQEKQPVFVAHLFDQCGYHAAIHNRVLQPLAPSSKAFLFARFAWTVIFRTKAFLTTGPERVVRVRGDDGSLTTVTMGGVALRLAYGGGGARDTTPLKRARSDKLTRDPYTDLLFDNWETSSVSENDHGDDGMSGDEYM